MPDSSLPDLTRKPRLLPAGASIALLALLKFTIQMATAGRYGIFRDELYYVACARHLGWGYVDHPPLIALLTWLSVHALGTSLFALRLLPAIAGSLLVWITALIAKELGGGRFAQSLAGFATIPVPIYLTLTHWLTMNAFEPLLWMTAVWLTLRMLACDQPKYWIAIGTVCGIGLENKYSTLLFAAALIVGLLLAPQRRILNHRWFVLGVCVAILLFLPNLIWLVGHHFPFLEFEHNSRLSGARIARTPLAFVADQALIMNPLLAPLWIGGLFWLLAAKSAAAKRFLAFTFLLVLLPLLALQAKNYYAAGAYPVLFAAGAVAFEQASDLRMRWARSVYVSLVLLSGLLLAPFALPILPVPKFIAYQNFFHGFNPIRFENQPASPLPQHFADEFGWEAMARETGRVYAALSEVEKKDTAIFANDYGEAAAIDFFGAKYGLPSAIGNNESYWLWGPRNYTGKTAIVLGSDGEGDRQHFRSVQAAGEVDDSYARPDERFTIFLCRDLSPELKKLWPSIKNW